uniref:Uncharacterized protein n=1 Tax=Arundo donax TaxID=35708 RepID=A0A0A9HPP4_ARUDO
MCMLNLLLMNNILLLYRACLLFLCYINYRNVVLHSKNTVPILFWQSQTMYILTNT